MKDSVSTAPSIIAVFVIYVLAGFQATVFTRHGVYAIISLLTGAYFSSPSRSSSVGARRYPALRRYKGMRPGIFMLVPSSTP